MAKQVINIGTIDDDGTGDTIRAGGDKINDNFTELYGLIWNETTVNLASAGWSASAQTETISGLTASSDVLVFPPVDRTAYLAYGAAQISATATGTNTITFTCTTTPVADINNVIVLWR